MAGFAVHLCQFFEHPQAELNSSALLGQLEDNFLMQFVNKQSDVECRGSSKEVCTAVTDKRRLVLFCYIDSTMFVCL